MTPNVWAEPQLHLAPSLTSYRCCRGVRREEGSRSCSLKKLHKGENKSSGAAFELASCNSACWPQTKPLVEKGLTHREPHKLYFLPWLLFHVPSAQMGSVKKQPQAVVAVGFWAEPYKSLAQAFSFPVFARGLPLIPYTCDFVKAPPTHSKLPI